MKRFCTAKFVWSSPRSGQLHEALPGPSAGAFADGAGLSARSVPSVDSTIVFNVPMTMKRHGVIQGSVDSGFTGPFRTRSSGCGNATVYSVLFHFDCNRVPQ